MENKPKHCLNCQHTLSPEDRYCPNCGLESVYRNLSLRFLVKSFFEAFLNFDVKIFHSMRDIWVPNRITKTFLEGRREYHVHPFRFYFICLIIFFTLLSIYTKKMHFNDLDLKADAAKFELYQKLDTLGASYGNTCPTEVFDSIRSKIYTGTANMDKDTFYRLRLLGRNLRKYGVSSYDAVTLEPDSIFRKYNVEPRLDRFLMTQMSRISVSPESATRFFIGNMIWGLILLTVLIAAFLKLLYIRHDSYYIEHLLHIANYHCFNLIILSIAMFLQLFFKWSEFEGIVVIIHTVGILYLGISLKQYYGENVFKTVIKLIMLGVFYWLSILLILAIIALISIIIY